MKILLVDDDEVFRIAAVEILKKSGYEIVDLEDMPSDVEKVLRDTKPHVVLLDLFLPNRSGMDILRDIKVIDPRIPVIIITAEGDVKYAVEAIKAGAYDFIGKPLNFVRLDTIVKNAGNLAKMSRKLYAYESMVRSPANDMGLIGSDIKMERVLETIQNVAPTSASVLITGETGTGKELVAKALHKMSGRKGELVEIDCGTLPRELMESELFGHEKGAFTGATSMKSGRIEQAVGGTLFLDEISELELSLQVKLLRFLEERYIIRIGGIKKIEIDTRVISATNRNPMEEIKMGRFREDLYYRLNVINIHVPPLRDKKDDIPLITAHFVNMFCIENDMGVIEVAPEALGFLMDYNWPGNVRELRNTIERIVVMYKGQKLVPEFLPEYILDRKETNGMSSQPAPPAALQEILPLEEVKKGTYINALNVCGGNVYETARRLKISPNTLYRQIDKFNINVSPD